MSLVYSIELCGNIKENNTLSVKLCIPYFNLGLWSISVSSISYKPSDINLNGICHISTNLFKSQRYSLSNRVEIFNPIVATVLLKTEPNTFQVFHFNPNWFLVNDTSDTLILKLEHFETNMPFLHNTFISVNVLLRKIK